MVKKILIHLVCTAVLAGAILGVFWFNASEASRKTVTADDDIDSDYVPDPEDQGTVFPDQPDGEGSLIDGSEGEKDDGSGGDGSDVERPDPEKEAYLESPQKLKPQCKKPVMPRP